MTRPVVVAFVLGAWVALFVADRLRALADTEDEIRQASRRPDGVTITNPAGGFGDAATRATFMREAARRFEPTLHADARAPRRPAVAEHRHHDGGWRRST